MHARTRPHIIRLTLCGVAAAVGCKGSTEPRSAAGTHPEGAIAATTQLGHRPFGAALSTRGAYYITRLDAATVERGDLPGFTFTGSASVGLVPTDVAFNPAGTRAWVTNQWSQTVGEIAAAENRQVRTVALTGDAFHVIVSPDGRTVYASDNGQRLYAIDVEAGTILGTLSLSSISNGMAFNPSGTRLYASLLFSGEIAEIDARSHTLLRTMRIGGTVLQDVVVSLDGTELYVADEGEALLRIVNVSAGTETGTVALGGGGFGVALSPDDAQLYVSIPSGGVVRVIDRETRTIVKSIATGGTPRHLAFSADGATAVIANEDGWVDFIR